MSVTYEHRQSTAINPCASQQHRHAAPRSYARALACIPDERRQLAACASHNIACRSLVPADGGSRKRGAHCRRSSWTKAEMSERDVQCAPQAARSRRSLCELSEAERANGVRSACFLLRGARLVHHNPIASDTTARAPRASNFQKRNPRKYARCSFVPAFTHSHNERRRQSLVAQEERTPRALPASIQDGSARSSRVQLQATAVHPLCIAQERTPRACSRLDPRRQRAPSARPASSPCVCLWGGSKVRPTDVSAVAGWSSLPGRGRFSPLPSFSRAAATTLESRSNRPKKSRTDLWPDASLP